MSHLPPVFFLIPVVFAFAAASMAKGKNRRSWLWFIIGLFTGPIALFLVLMLKAGPGEDQGYE